MAQRPPSLHRAGDRSNAAGQRIDNLRYPRTGQALYATAAWKRARAIILSRQPVCVLCNNAPATDVDHVVPIRDGGAKLDGANLQPLCQKCHSRKTVSEVFGRNGAKMAHFDHPGGGSDL